VKNIQPSAVSPYPQLIGTIHVEGTHVVHGESILAGVDLKLPAMISKQTAARPNPEVTLLVLREGRNETVPDSRGVGSIENRESDAVKTSQPFLGSYPEIAVTGSEDGGDGVVRQAVFALPHMVTVLGQGFERVQGCGILRLKAEPQKQYQSQRAGI
jgi:hypothetical protein